jgi:hypothetical protein
MAALDASGERITEAREVEAVTLLRQMQQEAGRD